MKAEASVAAATWSRAGGRESDEEEATGHHDAGEVEVRRGAGMVSHVGLNLSELH